MYKIIYGYVDLNISDFFSLCHSKYNLHKHGFTSKPLRRPCKEHLNNFFTHRATQIWNKLPESVVSAPTIAAFKNRLKSLTVAVFHHKCIADFLLCSCLSFYLAAYARTAVV